MLLIDIGTTFVKSVKHDSDNIFRTRNLQGEYGSDVLTRLEYSLRNQDNRSLLRERLFETIILHLENHKISFRYDNMRISGLPEKVIIIGNSVMEGFFYGLDMRSLAAKPFRLPRYNTDFKSEILFLPGIGGFAGSDILPLISKMKNYGNLNSAGFDFGTNCEIILETAGKYIVSSAPAGPAFENISYFSDRLINEVEFDSVLKFWKNTNEKADYILPHAFIKLISLLIKKRLVSGNGYISNPVVKDNVVVNTEKIRDLLKAKAAVSSTFRIMSKYFSKQHTPEKIFISGNMINSESIQYMKDLGIIPDIPVIIGEGDFRDFCTLCSNNINNIENLINSIKERVYYFPHYNLPDYDEIFIKELNFGEYV